MEGFEKDAWKVWRDDVRRMLMIILGKKSRVVACSTDVHTYALINWIPCVMECPRCHRWGGDRQPGPRSWSITACGQTLPGSDFDADASSRKAKRAPVPLSPVASLPCYNGAHPEYRFKH